VEIWTGGTRTRTQNVKLETSWVWGNYAEIANLVTACVHCVASWSFGLRQWRRDRGHRGRFKHLPLWNFGPGVNERELKA
jgi:hypothetical protein